MQGLSCINLEMTPTPKKTKNKFTELEDEIIKQFVQDNGAHTWGRILPLLPGRTSRQVRERYVNYLSPDVKRNQWTREEDELIIKLVSKFGKRWAYISRSFNQRTDVSIKNRYLLLKRKEQKRMKNKFVKESTKEEEVLHIEQQYEREPFENQLIDNIPINDVIEEHDFQIDMFDSDSIFAINDGFFNDNDFQFFT